MLQSEFIKAIKENNSIILEKNDFLKVIKEVENNIIYLYGYRKYKYSSKDFFTYDLETGYSFCGFIYQDQLYNASYELSKQLEESNSKRLEDLNKVLCDKIKKLIASRIPASKSMQKPELTIYDVKDLEYHKEHGAFNDALRYFMNNKKSNDIEAYYPTFKNANRSRYDNKTLLQFLINPDLYKSIALEVVESCRKDIYIYLLRHEMTMEKLKEIENNTDSIYYKMRNISDSIQDQKTVNLHLFINNQDLIVKCDADAVKRLKYCDSISSSSINAQDREKLKCITGDRWPSIKPDDIKQITYSKKVLWKDQKNDN